MGFVLRLVLESSIIALGLISAIVGYLLPKSPLVVGLGLLIAFFALVALAGDVKTHFEERNDFRKKILENAVRTVDSIIGGPPLSSISFSHLSSETWMTKSEGLKRDLLGDGDYALWKQFYDNIVGRNNYLEAGRPISFEIFAKYNRAIFDSFLAAYEAISWVKESISKERIADFQMRAQNSATL